MRWDKRASHATDTASLLYLYTNYRWRTFFAFFGSSVLYSCMHISQAVLRCKAYIDCAADEACYWGGVLLQSLLQTECARLLELPVHYVLLHVLYSKMCYMCNIDIKSREKVFWRNKRHPFLHDEKFLRDEK